MNKKLQQQSLAGFDDKYAGSPNTRSVAPEKETMQSPPVIKGKTVYAVDAHSLFFQVFHALPEMSSPTGQPVGAVFGFSRDILYLLDEKKPDFLFCAFDLPGKTFRHGLFSEYKIQRDEMPADLRPQIPAVQQLLEAMRIPVVSCESYEADDVLATIARHCEQLGADCYVVTGDKDCRQLITDRVRIYNVRKDLVYDRESLWEDWGIQPSQVVDFQALVGDPVDNVPGVPLIGPKIARELLEKYGTLEDVLSHANEVSGKKRRAHLLEGRDQAMLSRKLVRLEDQVPVEIDFAAAQVRPVDPGMVRPLFEEFGFRSLARRFREAQADVAVTPWKADYRTVATEAELEQLVDQLQQQPIIAVDTETTSLDARRAELVGYSFAWNAGEAYYIPVRGPQGQPQMDPATTRDALRKVLENPAVKKVGQNLK